MKHTPPPLVFPASVVLSIRKTEKLSDGVTAVSGTEPCFSQTKDVTVPNVPLETNPGSKIVHLILQGLDISEQNNLGFVGMVDGPGPACVWSLLILDFVITLNLVLSDALTNDTSDRNCV